MFILDFAKAFFHVNHQSLPLKIKKYGVSGNIFNSLSTGRVPKEYIPRPMLFAIIINDPSDDIVTTCMTFTHNTKF